MAKISWIETSNTKLMATCNGHSEVTAQLWYAVPLEKKKAAKNEENKNKKHHTLGWDTAPSFSDVFKQIRKKQHVLPVLQGYASSQG